MSTVGMYLYMIFYIGYYLLQLINNENKKCLA